MTLATEFPSSPLQSSFDSCIKASIPNPINYQKSSPSKVNHEKCSRKSTFEEETKSETKKECKKEIVEMKKEAPYNEVLGSCVEEEKAVKEEPKEEPKKKFFLECGHIIYENGITEIRKALINKKDVRFTCTNCEKRQPLKKMLLACGCEMECNDNGKKPEFYETKCEVFCCNKCPNNHKIKEEEELYCVFGYSLITEMSIEYSKCHMHLLDIDTDSFSSHNIGAPKSKLCFPNSKLSDIAVTAVSEAIESLMYMPQKDGIPSIRNLKVLNLAYNEIGDIGATKVAHLLDPRWDLKLETLNLSNNRISTEGCSEIARFLGSNNDLENLFLGNNNIENGGLHTLAIEFAINSKLKLLSLHNNNCSDAGVESLVAGLKNNTNLQFFELTGNAKITKKGLEILKGLEEFEKIGEKKEYMYVRKGGKYAIKSQRQNYYHVQYRV